MKTQTVVALVALFVAYRMLSAKAAPVPSVTTDWGWAFPDEYTGSIQQYVDTFFPDA